MEQSYIPRLRDLAHALDAKAADLESFWDLSQDLLLISSPEGIILRANPAWQRCLDYSSEEMVGHSYLEFVHPEDHEKTQNAARVLQVLDLNNGFTNRYIAKDGSIRFLEWRSTRYTTDVRGLKVSYAVARDVTYRMLDALPSGES